MPVPTWVALVLFVFAAWRICAGLAFVAQQVFELRQAMTKERGSALGGIDMILESRLGQLMRRLESDSALAYSLKRIEMAIRDGSAAREDHPPETRAQDVVTESSPDADS